MATKRNRVLWVLLSIVVLLVAVRWISGTPHGMRRGVGAAATRLERLADPAEEARVAAASWEDDGTFEIGTVELDDQGIFWDRRQLDLATEKIRAAEATGAIVVVFVHGWQHDGRVCDGNFSCLREALRYLSEAEESFSHLRGGVRRRILGVFLSWRGASTEVPAFAQASFWERLEAARRVGRRGDALAAFSAIHSATEGLRKTPSGAATRLVVVGHSMGAALTWSALGKRMESQLLDAIRASPETCVDPAAPMRGFADLVVLVNPAFEAAEIRSVLETSRAYRGYCPSQAPLALVAMSESDKATGIAFPLGRKLATFTEGFRGDERDQAVTAIGHYPPFDTHRLTLVGDPPAELDPARREARCGCATALGHFDPARHLANLRRNGESRDFKNLHFATERSYGASRLSPLPGVDLPADLPFLVARVEPKIIDGHGDFFNPAFVDFLVNFVAAIDYKRAAWEEAP